MPFCPNLNLTASRTPHGYITADLQYTLKHYKEVKFILEQAMKAQRQSRGIALLFL
jgi:hypothetical protein